MLIRRKKKLDESLDAYQHIIDMGFGRGQNFYVAAIFRTFTALARVKRQDEAQKALKQWEGWRDKVPNDLASGPGAGERQVRGHSGTQRAAHGNRAPIQPGPDNVRRDQPTAQTRPSRGKRRGFRFPSADQGRGIFRGFRPEESCAAVRPLHRRGRL